MPGRINDEDIATVRERARIDEVVGSHVALRNAGSGTMKGLCPFHDEKTPSFQVNPSRGFYYCFGCGEGGDVISFVQKIDNLSFTETVERLADRVGIQLRYTDGGASQPERGHRLRLMEAHQAAAEFYAEQLSGTEAAIGRQFLSERGFDRATAEHFGVGYAPQDGRALRRHLNGRGFRDPELVAGGLIREAGWDYFQGRLLWPIRDSGRQVLGFGARRLREDDRMPAKYLNTPETPLYKKSHVLYGLDLARQQIGKKSQAVVVEGYTDVMAAHVAGVDTAVASCGTAFGDDHARLLRRLMGNHDAFRGEVIFTFDGDAAGQAAALKVFGGDANFIAQTYVAVEPSGLDPCDLRLQHGDAAVRELVARRVPLYRFVMANILTQHDLDRADGRLSALREAAPLVASVRDYKLSSEYVRELSNMVGMDIEEVRREVALAAKVVPRPAGTSVRISPPAATAARADGRRRSAVAAGAERPAAGHGACRPSSCCCRRPQFFGADWRRARGRRLHPPRLRRDLPHHAAGARDGGRRPASGGVDPPRPLLGSAPDAGPTGRLPCGRAVLLHGRHRVLRPGRSRQAAAADGDAPGERAEVQAAADEPGGEPDHVQPDVLRARGPRSSAQ